MSDLMLCSHAPSHLPAEDDTIYLYPNVGLPSVLGGVPHGYDATWQEVAKVLGALAAADGEEEQ
jgi:hypothetical protein